MKKEKSELYNRCCKCVDQIYIDWNKTTLSTTEKKTVEDYMAWGVVKLALYILNTDEYNAFKEYIYDKHGYDAGGVRSGQMSIEEWEKDDL